MAEEIVIKLTDMLSHVLMRENVYHELVKEDPNLTFHGVPIHIGTDDQFEEMNCADKDVLLIGKGRWEGLLNGSG